MNGGLLRHNPRRVLYCLAALFLLAVVRLGAQSPAEPARPRHQTGQGTILHHTRQAKPVQPVPAKRAKDKFHRPPLQNPIRPTVPEVNRYLPNKVFLEQADSLYKLENDLDGRQIVKGGVVFRQANMWLYCDSAYYYPDINSLDAFGHVRLKQNDVTSMQADRVYYDGDSRLAQLRCGPSQPKVILRDKTATLTTDSLDYDLTQSLGWYDCGGVLVDGPTRLTSIFGEYNTDSKDADFYNDVVLVNSKDNYTLRTDTLYYNTASKTATIVSPTTIVGPDDEIYATDGWYNTATGMTQLISRSKIVHRDSVGNATLLEGDSLVYDRERRITYAYSFRNIGKHPTPVVVTDTANKTMLVGGYGLYDQLNRVAMATEYPLMIEFSRPDTLFLRADTIYSYIVDARPDSLDSVKIASGIDVRLKQWRCARAYNRARFFNQQLQGVADSMVFTESDSLLRMFYSPIVWSGERQVNGPVIHVHFNDSTADYADLPQGGMASEYVDSDGSTHFYNQLYGRKMHAVLENKTLKHLDVEGNVQTIVLPAESDSTYNRLVHSESSFMSVDMRGRKIGKLKMWPEVTGFVTPLFLLKPGEQLLPDFEWYEKLRPERAWYGEHIRWVDNLGEVSDELDEHFRKARNSK